MNCRDIAELAPLYLSRELPADELREFERHLGRCRSCALEIDQEASIDARLRAAVGDEMPETATLNRAVITRIDAVSVRRRQFIGVAAAVLLLTAGGAAWWSAHEGSTPRPYTRLYTDAARDHQLEVVEHQPRRWRSGAAGIETLAARYGLPARAAATLGPAGFRLQQAKICGLEGRPVLHLVYTNGAREVSLYLRRNDAQDRSDLHEAVLGREYVDTFRTDRFVAVIVAQGSRADCRQFSRSAAVALQ
jgi:anti-sigma factor RsiW